jgi:hypothetical protein
MTISEDIAKIEMWIEDLKDDVNEGFFDTTSEITMKTSYIEMEIRVTALKQMQEFKETMSSLTAAVQYLGDK